MDLKTNLASAGPRQGGGELKSYRAKELRRGFTLQNFSKKNLGGFITLISVLVVGAVGLSIALSLLLLGLGASRTSFALQQSVQARGLSNACAEEALRKIKNSIAFSGNATLNLSGGDCTYTVTNTGGQNRTITTTGTVGSVVRKISISITQITPVITISSWQEVP